MHALRHRCEKVTDLLDLPELPPDILSLIKSTNETVISGVAEFDILDHPNPVILPREVRDSRD